MRRSNLLDAGLCTERVCCRLFAIWQGLAYKGSWIHAGVHRARRCSSDLGLSVQPPEETTHHQLLKTYTRRTTHAIHKFLCSCKIVWRRGHGCSGSWWPVRSKWPEDEHQFKLAVFRGTGNSRMGHLGQSCLNEDMLLANIILFIAAVLSQRWLWTDNIACIDILSQVEFLL